MTMETKLRPVATDKGIEGLAEIAQAALAANYGDAKSAIADAVRHMRRIIRKAEAQDGEWQVVKVEPTRGAHIDFTGRLIGQTRFVTDSDDPMLITMKVWQTKGGSYVAEFTSRPEYGDGFVNIRAEVFPLIDDVQEMRFGVMDFFDWTDGARSMARKMDWKLRRDVP